MNYSSESKYNRHAVINRIESTQMTKQAHAYSNLKQVAQETNLAKQSQGSHTPFWEWGRAHGIGKISAVLNKN